MKTNSLYITSMEPGAGKLTVSLGIMELLTRRLSRVGFFRPVVDDDAQSDSDIELIRSRYSLEIPPENMFGCRAHEAKAMVAEGRFRELLETIIDKYKALEEDCEFVLCEGLNSQGFISSFDFDINLNIAKNLAGPVVVVFNGVDKGVAEIADGLKIMADSINSEGCTLFGAFINRLKPGVLNSLAYALREVKGVDGPIYLLPEEKELDSPSLAEIVNSLDATCVLGDHESLTRVVKQCKIAAMNLNHFLDYIEDGDLIITPGDRADIILGTLATFYSYNAPTITGILLTGGLIPPENVMQLVKGMRRFPVPLLSAADDTFTTAMAVNNVKARITAGNERKIALALGLFESSVDTGEIEKRIALAKSESVTPIMFEYSLFAKAKVADCHIVLPEGMDKRILRAAEILLRREVVQLTLLGQPQKIEHLIASLGLELSGVNIIDPAESPDIGNFAEQFYELRKQRGMTREAAIDAMSDPTYFGTMMVYNNKAQGMVSGAIHTTQDTIRPAFQIIKTRPGVSIVSSVFLMCLDTRVLVYGDCAVNPDPDAEQLAEIAISSADTAAMFDIEPRVALLSYSTGESGKGAEVEKVRKAAEIAGKKRPDLKLEGPIQYDAAIDPQVAGTKLPNSEVAGRATVFIFPDLNTGNNTYKAVQRSSGAVAIGPILQGLKKPVNDLSRGCLVADIVNTVAITAIQAQAVK